MSIFQGNNIASVYKGSSPIKEIYKGNQLLYSSGLKLWGFDNGSVSAFVLGTYDINGFVIVNLIIDKPTGCTITNIGGTLGESGSNITVTLAEQYTDYAVYSNTKTAGGKTIYTYTIQSGMLNNVYYVIENSEVGDICLYGGLSDIGHPTNINENILVVNNNTYNRNTSLDCSWNKNGII